MNRVSSGLKKVLVVEDDLALRPFWELFFFRLDSKISVEWAVSSEQAEFMVNQSNDLSCPYGLIVADIFLAGSGTGLEFLQSKAVVNSGAKRVLVSSAEGDSVQKVCRDLLPATTVISKPLNLVKCDRIFDGWTI